MVIVERLSCVSGFRYVYLTETIVTQADISLTQKRLIGDMIRKRNNVLYAIKHDKTPMQKALLFARFQPGPMRE